MKEREQFKFSIRDLFWLTTIVALATGWFINSRSWKRYHRDRIESYILENDRLEQEAFEDMKLRGQLDHQNNEMRIAIEGKDAMLRRLLEKEHKAIQERKE